MSIAISLKVNDGVILAANSITTFLDSVTEPPREIRNNARRIFNLTNLSPIAALSFGVGGIGPNSIATLSGALRERLRGGGEFKGHACTMEEVAKQARTFFFDEMYSTIYPTPIQSFSMGYRVCGYSPGAPTPEIWEFMIEGAACSGPYEVQPNGQCGICWAGENKALDKLLLGPASGIKHALMQHGYSESDVEGIYREIMNRFPAGAEFPLAPAEDAIETARFLIELAPDLTPAVPDSRIKGFTEIALITREEGFQWILRKQSFDEEHDLASTRPQNAGTQ